MKAQAVREARRPSCHPEPAQRGEGPRIGTGRLLAHHKHRLQLEGPLPFESPASPFRLRYGRGLG
jgi:hypothetical protein